MNKSTLSLIEFSAADESLMSAVGRLRVAAWSIHLPTVPAQRSWLDNYDPGARHWAFIDKGQLIASARLSVHSSLDEVPAPEDYSNLFTERLPSPIGSINRLVVAPSHRGLGLSSQLDRVRIDAAIEMGCRCIVGSTPSGDKRIAQLVAQGFRVLGSAGAGHTTAMLQELPPAVAVIRYLADPLR